MPDSVRVLVVGDDVRGLHDVDCASVVGRATPDDLVPAIEMLEPEVLLLSSGVAALAARMSSSPAGVVVTQAMESGIRTEPVARSLLEIALQLALVCP